MKRSIILMLSVLLLLTGCGEKSNTEDNKTTEPTTSTSSVTTSNDKTTESTKKESENSTKKTTSSKTTKKTTTKKTTTNKPSSRVNNTYTSIKTGKKNKYTFIYATEAECKKNADEDAYNSIYEKHPYVAFDCEEIKDNEGKKMWGAFFYKEADENSIFYY